MKTKSKTAIGSLLAIIGALGIILGPAFGLTDLSGSWSFIAGFFSGLATGLGFVLAVSGLISRRKNAG